MAQLPMPQLLVPSSEGPRKERPIDDPAGEPRPMPVDGTERPRPRPSNDPDVVPPHDGREERRPRPEPQI